MASKRGANADGSSGSGLSISQLIHAVYGPGYHPVTVQDLGILDGSRVLAISIAMSDLSKDARCLSHFAKTETARAVEKALHIMLMLANSVPTVHSVDRKPSVSVYLEVIKASKVTDKKPVGYRVWLFVQASDWNPGAILQDHIEKNSVSAKAKEGFTLSRVGMRSSRGHGGGGGGGGGGAMEVADNEAQDAAMAAGDAGGAAAAAAAGARPAVRSAGVGLGVPQARLAAGPNKKLNSGYFATLEDMDHVETLAQCMQIKNLLRYDVAAATTQHDYPEGLKDPKNPLNPLSLYHPTHAMALPNAHPDQTNLSKYMDEAAQARDGHGPAYHDGVHHPGDGRRYSFPFGDHVYRIRERDIKPSRFLRLALPDPNIDGKRAPQDMQRLREQFDALRQGGRGDIRVLSAAEQKLAIAPMDVDRDPNEEEEEVDGKDEKEARPDAGGTDAYEKVMGDLFDACLPTYFGNGERITATYLRKKNTEERNNILNEVRKMRSQPDKYTAAETQKYYETRMVEFYKKAMAEFRVVWSPYGENSNALKAAINWLNEYLETHDGKMYVPFPKMTKNLSYFQDFVVHYLNQIEMIFKGSTCHEASWIDWMALLNSSDPNRKDKLHVLQLGQAAVSKSFCLDLLDIFSVPNTVEQFTYKSMRADASNIDLDGETTVMHEADYASLGVAPNGSKQPVRNEREGMLKERMTSGKIRFRDLHIDKETGERITRTSECLCNGTMLMNSNSTMAEMTEEILNRFYVQVFTARKRPGRNIIDLICNQESIEFKKLKAVCIERMRRIHCLVILTNELINCGVLLPVNTEYSNVMFNQILAKAEKLGVPNTDMPRHLSRMFCAVRACTIVRAVLLRFSSTLSPFKDKKFELEDMLSLGPQLVDDDPALCLSALGFMDDQYYDAIQYNVLEAVKEMYMPVTVADPKRLQIAKAIRDAKRAQRLKRKDTGEDSDSDDEDDNKLADEVVEKLRDSDPLETDPKDSGGFDEPVAEDEPDLHETTMFLRGLALGVDGAPPADIRRRPAAAAAAATGDELDEKHVGVGNGAAASSAGASGSASATPAPGNRRDAPVRFYILAQRALERFHRQGFLEKDDEPASGSSSIRSKTAAAAAAAEDAHRGREETKKSGVEPNMKPNYYVIKDVKIFQLEDRDDFKLHKLATRITQRMISTPRLGDVVQCLRKLLKLEVKIIDKNTGYERYEKAFELCGRGIRISRALCDGNSKDTMKKAIKQCLQHKNTIPMRVLYGIHSDYLPYLCDTIDIKPKKKAEPLQIRNLNYFSDYMKKMMQAATMSASGDRTADDARVMDIFYGGQYLGIDMPLEHYIFFKHAQDYGWTGEQLAKYGIYPESESHQRLLKAHADEVEEWRKWLDAGHSHEDIVKDLGHDQPMELLDYPECFEQSTAAEREAKEQADFLAHPERFKISTYARQWAEALRLPENYFQLTPVPDSIRGVAMSSPLMRPAGPLFAPAIPAVPVPVPAAAAPAVSAAPPGGSSSSASSSGTISAPAVSEQDEDSEMSSESGSQHRRSKRRRDSSRRRHRHRHHEEEPRGSEDEDEQDEEDRHRRRHRSKRKRLHRDGVEHVSSFVTSG